MERLLWRLVLPHVHVPRDLEYLTEGLRLHLAHSALMSVLVQIDDIQQAYVAASACPGCRSGRHTPGCRIALLIQLLRATWDAQAILTLAPLGLANRSYTQFVYARPTLTSLPLAQLDLAAWPEARLLQDWQPSVRGLTTAALLAVADGPNPVPLLQEYGWRTHPLPRSVGLRLAQQPIPGALWFRRTWTSPPALLTPHSRRTALEHMAAPHAEAPRDPAARELVVAVEEP